VRLGRVVASVLLAPVAALALLEVALRVEGAVRTRATARPPDGTDVVLCVGDSHTRGLPDPDNVPCHLQRLLDAHALRPHRVVNLGVPGLTTGQLRARLPRWVDYYRPAVIVFWGGVNNGWRQTEPPWRRRAIARLGDHSRAVQILRLIHFFGGLRFTRLETDGFEATDWRGIHAVWRMDFAGAREDLNTEPGEALPADVVEATTRDDLGAMMTSARARGIRMYGLTYELPAPTSAP
jgi:lysophospholipase L1-like esterase